VHHKKISSAVGIENKDLRFLDSEFTFSFFRSSINTVIIITSRVLPPLSERATVTS
jgi:hypothetical protein